MELQELVRHSLEPIRDTGNNSLVLQFADYNSRIEAWGQNWIRRDQQLRELVLSEPFLSAAVFNIASTRAAFSWKVSGPTSTAGKIQDMLNASQYRQGFHTLKLMVAYDVLTQDNGGFVYVIRKEASYNAPVLGLVHLDAGRCYRTGNPLKPVIYIDEDRQEHLLEWFQVMTFEDMPHPSYRAHGRQVCFVSRILRAAETIKELMRYKEEKISGRYTRAIHVVGGVSSTEMEDAKKTASMSADNVGLLHYMEPIILTTLDPSATVSHVQIDMATLPDGFQESEQLKWYITLIAMAAGGEYQDFSPLPGGNLGTSSQSETLHKKAQAKGHALWMKTWEIKLRMSGAIPKNVAFQFQQQDPQAEMERAKIQKLRAETREIRITSGEITPSIAQQIAVDDGDLRAEYLTIMGQADATPVTTVYDDDAPISNKSVAYPVARYAANLITHKAQTSRINSLSQADFLQYLPDTIRIDKETVLFTTDHWMCDELVYAAVKAGISPKVLRDRLPSNWRVTIYSNKVCVNGETVYTYSPTKCKLPEPQKRFISKRYSSDVIAEAVQSIGSAPIQDIMRKAMVEISALYNIRPATKEIKNQIVKHLAVPYPELWLPAVLMRFDATQRQSHSTN